MPINLETQEKLQNSDTEMVMKEIEECSNASVRDSVIPTKDTKVFKWVYNFWPAKILCTYQDIHIGGGQQQKNGAKSSKP